MRLGSPSDARRNAALMELASVLVMVRIDAPGPSQRSAVNTRNRRNGLDQRNQLLGMEYNEVRLALACDQDKALCTAEHKGVSRAPLIQRLQALIADPSVRLGALQKSIALAFHRMYQQRNHILYGGITTSVGFAPTLRTTSCLTGAGIDRLAHGLYAGGLAPMELAAKA